MTELYKEVLDMAELAIKLTEGCQMTDDQAFLEFLDELNQLSVKY